MVKDTLNSVFDNLKERTTNPFLGTLIVVWLVHNWKLVYSLFYFDSKLTLDERLIYIEAYFLKMPFYINLLLVLVFTILVLCVTYFFLGLSRFISDFYEKGVVPRIVKFNDKSAVVLKSESDRQKEFIKHLEVRVEEERLAKVAARAERDNEVAKLAKLEEIESNQKENKENTNTHKRVYDTLRTYSSIAEINSIIQNIQNKKSNPPDDIAVRTLLQEDFINKDPRSSLEGRYTFTDEGKKFVRYWNNNS